MKKIVIALLLVVMIAAILVLVPSGALVEGITPLPIDNDPCYGPWESGYQYEEGKEDPVGYEDPSVSVSIGRGRWMETDYVYARVKIADASQLRTQLAGRYGSDNTTAADRMAKHVKAVLALNGDYYTRNGLGCVIRQGKTYRMNCNGEWDVLMIDTKGDFHILRNATNDQCRELEADTVNAFTFGPGLVIDGQGVYGVNSDYMATGKPAQRMCLAQTGPLEYLVLTTEGPEDPGSTGLTIDQFVDLIVTFGDVQQAYNMDGGSSSSLVFKNAKQAYAKINCPKNSKIRYLTDIVYFASAAEQK